MGFIKLDRSSFWDSNTHTKTAAASPVYWMEGTRPTCIMQIESRSRDKFFRQIKFSSHGWFMAAICSGSAVVPSLSFHLSSSESISSALREMMLLQVSEAVAFVNSCEAAESGGGCWLQVNLGMWPEEWKWRQNNNILCLFCRFNGIRFQAGVEINILLLWCDCRKTRSNVATHCARGSQLDEPIAQFQSNIMMQTVRHDLWWLHRFYWLHRDVNFRCIFIVTNTGWHQHSWFSIVPAFKLLGAQTNRRGS